MISNRCVRISLVTSCNSIISKNYLRFLVDSNGLKNTKSLIMKIAFLYKFFPSSGGVERVMTILANELTRVGYFVRIYSFRQCLEAPAYPLNNNVEIFHLPDKSKINSINNVKFLVEAVNSREFDILFNHDSTFDSMSLCNQVKKEIAVKIITLHHGQIYLPVTSL